jgi:uncharacterized membrane protein
MLENNTERKIINRQLRQTGNIVYTRRRQKKPQHNIGQHYTQTNTNDVNKTWALLQTTFWLELVWIMLSLYAINMCPTIKCIFDTKRF